MEKLKDMNVTQYMNAIAMEIGAETSIVEKTNGVIFHGVLKGDSNCKPTVYVDSYYVNDIPVSEAAKEIDEILSQNQRNFDVSELTNYEYAKGMLRARLYNKATNADVFRKSRDFKDLIIVPYIDLGDVNGDGGRASTKVTAQLVERWGVTEKEVIDTALKNSKADVKIQSMETMLAEIMGMPTREEELGINPEMIVLTNKDKYYGAITAITAKAKLKKLFPNGYVILPSSIHEVIAVPYQPGTEEMLNGMVCEVNTNEVKPEEILGSRAYIFAA